MNMENYNNHKKYYHNNGNMRVEHYLLNNKVHRTDGPATILYYHENGNVSSEYYYLNGELHRTDGPTIIIYSENGNIESEYYYLNDILIKVNSLEEFKKYKKTLMLR